MEKPKLGSFIASSEDPTKVANTVRGLVLASSSVIILVAAQVFHVQLGAQDIVTLATDLGMLAGAVLTIYGLIMKAVIFFGKKREA